jgi:hypothetical protein
MRSFINCISPNTFRVIKSRRMRWAGHVGRMGEMRNAWNLWSENLNGRDNLEDLVVDGSIMLE